MWSAQIDGWKYMHDLFCIGSPGIIGLCLASPPRLVPTHKQVCMNPSRCSLSEQGWDVYPSFLPEMCNPCRRASNKVCSDVV